LRRSNALINVKPLGDGGTGIGGAFDVTSLPVAPGVRNLHFVDPGRLPWGRAFERQKNCMI